MKRTIGGVEAYRFFLPKLWSKNSEAYLSLHLVDTVLLDNNAVTTWLFTSKEGLVKSKSQRRRENPAEIAQHFQRLAVNGDLAAPAMLTCGTGCDYRVVKTASQLLDMLSNKANDTMVLLLPNMAMRGKLLVRVSYERPAEAVATSSGFLDTSKLKIKTFLPSKPLHSNLINFEKTDFLESRNPTYNTLSREAVLRVVREVEARCSQQIDKMVAYFYLSLEEEGSVVESKGASTCWLHHIECATLSDKYSGMKESDSVSCVSSRLSALDASMQSRANYLKPGSMCMGDFCPLSRPVDNGTDWDDDLVDGSALGSDVKTETRRAINRHRRLEDSTGDELKEDASMTSTRTSMHTLQQIPIKERTVMIKSILLAREEMELLEDIDKRFTQSAIDPSYRGSRGDESKIQMKVEIETIWPPHIARWWLYEGRSFQPVIPKVGKPPKPIGKTSKAAKRQDGDSLQAADDMEGNKWFSWYYSQAKVCENCYFNYQQLEIYRKAMHKKLQHQARLQSEEALLTPEERKLRDRRIEQRIFSQRKLATRLSKSKPVILENSDDMSLSRSKSSSVHHSQRDPMDLIPPSPWKHSTYHNYDNKTSITSHMLARSVTTVKLRGDWQDDSDHINQKWESMRQQALLEPLKLNFQRRLPKKKPNPKTVDVSNYTANRLLHPWQRDLDKLKRSKLGTEETPAEETPHDVRMLRENESLGGNGILGGGSNSSSIGQYKAAPIPFQPSRTSSWRDVIVEEEEEGNDDSDDDADQGGVMGWNPFVLNDDDN